ncbi:hypothetical protein [Heyndrickxia oleronia]|uniref:hypothetical protein n=1 Tax=Heyndrickxia oleronia TaxID=38875 RepID=UPI001B268ADD|nr:hypothetical protein [Heyndrickxia oleronia]GIN37199.1 hypothetical protein J19TS1_01480 [Heyndrickxia oleronia]
MKSLKIIYVIIVVIIIFLSGYFIGNIKNSKVSREIRIGHNHSDYPDRIDYQNVFTDVDNQEIIDNFLMIYLHKEKIENLYLEQDSPDIYIRVTSPKRALGLIDAKVWFTKEGAIIGERIAEGWEQTEYYSIDKDDADYIKKTV